LTQDLTEITQLTRVDDLAVDLPALKEVIRIAPECGAFGSRDVHSVDVGIGGRASRVPLRFDAGCNRPPSYLR
jgi:hypothetical protein